MGEGPLSHVHIVLVRPQQPGNVGVVARAIANHGMGSLILVDPQGFDPERARWMAPGAGEIIDGARFCATVAEAVAEMTLVVGTTGRARKWRWPVVDPPGLAEAALKTRAPVAVLFGPEDKGLSNEDLQPCHALLSLPTATHASLNLGQAVTVTCAGLLQAAADAGEASPVQRRQPPRKSASERWLGVEPLEEAAPSGRQSELVGLVLDVLDDVEYLAGRSKEQVGGSLYRMLSRAGPRVEELNFLTGMVKSVRHVLGRRAGRAPEGASE